MFHLELPGRLTRRLTQLYMNKTMHVTVNGSTGGGYFTTILLDIIISKDSFAIQVAVSYISIKRVWSSAQAVVLLGENSAFPGRLAQMHSGSNILEYFKYR